MPATILCLTGLNLIFVVELFLPQHLYKIAFFLNSLYYSHTQGSIDDVEALLKRHEDFENTLYAQDERLKAFSDLADKFIAAGHNDKA